MQSTMQQSTIPDRTEALRCQQDHVREGSNIQDVFKVEQIETPEHLQGHECLVEIRAVSLGVADIAALPYLRKGAVAGFDFAGVVRKCATGQWKEGERVAGMALGGLSRTIEGEGSDRFKNQGACATYVRTHCEMLFRIGDRVEFKDAATLPCSLLTAYQAMGLPSVPHHAKEHESILIMGADTSYGLTTVQLARACGYRVIAVADNEHRKIVEEYGADKVFDRTSNELAQKIRDATQKNLRLTVVATLMDNALEIATQSMPEGGEISVNPLLMAQFEEGGDRNRMMEEMNNKNRGNVKIVERSPVTLFGFNSRMDDKTFKPSHDETQQAAKFLKEVTRWLQEDKLRTLPSQNAQQQGIQGLLQAMEQIKREREKFAYKRLVSTLSGRQGQGEM